MKPIRAIALRASIGVVTVVTVGASAAATRTLVVDKDRAQCGNADPHPSEPQGEQT